MSTSVPSQDRRHLFVSPCLIVSSLTIYSAKNGLARDQTRLCFFHIYLRKHVLYEMHPTKSALHTWRKNIIHQSSAISSKLKISKKYHFWGQFGCLVLWPGSSKRFAEKVVILFWPQCLFLFLYRDSHIIIGFRLKQITSTLCLRTYSKKIRFLFTSDLYLVSPWPQTREYIDWRWQLSCLHWVVIVF